MRNYRDDSISRKLTRLNMLVAGLALILACSSFVGFDIWTFRQGSIRNLTIQARFVATNTLAAIEANDSPRIASVLTSLQEVPNIMSATIYSPDGRIVSVYHRDSSVSVPVFPGGLKEISDRRRFRSHDVNLIYVIRDRDRVIGSIYIQTDTQRLHERLMRYLQIVCVVMIASLLAAFLLSAGARRSISDPIIHVTTIAKIVSHDRNYQLRATPSKSRDEIGMLIQSFNEMLGHIEARDADLQRPTTNSTAASWNAPSSSKPLTRSSNPFRTPSPMTFALRSAALTALARHCSSIAPRSSTPGTIPPGSHPCRHRAHG
jgi:methyl-accepting chemotaxis protein